jgi:CubicO group peptidase (beta-lactamase class C family)
MHLANRRELVVLWLCLAVAGCGGGGSDYSGPPPLPAGPAPAAGTVGDARLPELIEWARSTQDVPAMTAMVIRNGQIAERGAAGLRSKGATARVTTQDQWHVGSITKSMTATLAATMVEDGSITWDTKPVELWPELATTVHADFRNTTLRQLLSHTSGLKRDDYFAAAADGAPGTPPQKRRAWAVSLLQHAAEVPAGTWQYSNVGYMVAGAMLESRASTPWETLLTARVFAPLGMTHSGFGLPGTAGLLDEPLGHRSTAHGFEPISAGDPDNVPMAEAPAGRVHSTLDDMASYLLAHLEGERGMSGLVSSATFVTLHTPVASGYAFGWIEEAPNAPLNARTLWHNGSNGDWYALLWMQPSGDRAVFIATNAGGERATAAVDALNAVLRERIANSP